MMAIKELETRNPKPETPSAVPVRFASLADKSAAMKAAQAEGRTLNAHILHLIRADIKRQQSQK